MPTLSKTTLVAFLAFLFSSALVSAEPSTKYLCVAEQSTGFKLENGKWKIKKFFAESKYLVQEVETFKYGKKIYNFQLKKFGEQSSVLNCTNIFTFMKKERKLEQITCGGLGMGLVLNTKSMRFQELYGYGYLDGKDKPGDTPSLTIGKCTKL